MGTGKFRDLGLTVGLEVHRQLDTRKKLFCDCPTDTAGSKEPTRVLRRLRPTQGELGQVDPAALFEFQRGRTFEYHANEDSSCLVEIDDEPPHDLNPEALEVALTAALLFGAKPVDEVHVMRKTVIDGSNTTGFQRTCVVALGGSIEVDGTVVPIQQISLEEDAARKLGEEGAITAYQLDRLAIPLIEVSTEPVITEPDLAQKAALAIGRLLKATRKMKKGIGAVRQDINISITKGALVEIKGIQQVDTISDIIKNEVERQIKLLEIRDELRARQITEQDLHDPLCTVTDLFAASNSRIIKKALETKGSVKALRLKGFGGLLKYELNPGLRFGTELASRASFWGRVGGVLHTDEDLKQVIGPNEASELLKRLKMEKNDAALIVAGDDRDVDDALSATQIRAIEAVVGIPDETRAALENGTTRFSRPRPGSARMYPETDVQPRPVSQAYIERLRTRLPPLPEKQLSDIMARNKLNRKLAVQLLDSEYLSVFEKVVAETSVAPSFVAAVLTEAIKSLRRENVPTHNLTENHLLKTFEAIENGRIAKEGIQPVLSWLASNPNSEVEDAIGFLGLKSISEADLDKIIEEVIESSIEIVQTRGLDAQGVLMGKVMRKVRGMYDGSIVSEKLRSKLEQLTKPA